MLKSNIFILNYKTHISMSNNYKHRHLAIYTAIAILLAAFATSSVIAQDEEEFIQESSQSEQTLNDPVKLFNQGQEAHEKGDLQNAVKFYQEAIKASIEFPEAEFQLANAYESLGKPAEAEKAFRRALLARPNWTLAMSGLGSLLIRKGEFTEAEAILNEAIRLSEMNFPAYVALTDLKLRINASEKDLADLLAKIQYLTTKAKTPAAIWASRAALERKLGIRDSAKTSINQALLIDPNNNFVLTEKIELAFIEGDYESAIRDSNKLIQLTPNYESSKILLARAYALSGDSAEALNVLNKIENPSASTIGLKTSIESRSNENIESLEKLLAEDKNNVAVLSRLCSLARVENPVKALEYCKQASALEPQNINHAIGYGAVLVQLKSYSNAVVLFRKLLDISPENYTIRANLATALFN